MPAIVLAALAGWVGGLFRGYAPGGSGLPGARACRLGAGSALVARDAPPGLGRRPCIGCGARHHECILIPGRCQFLGAAGCPRGTMAELGLAPDLVEQGPP